MTGKRKRDDAGIEPWIRNDRHHDYRINDQTSSRYDYRFDDQNTSRHDYRFDDQTKSRNDFRFNDQSSSRPVYGFDDQISSRLDYGFDGTSTNHGFNAQPNNSRLDYVFNDPSSSRSEYTRTFTDTTVASVYNGPESSDEVLKELGKCYLKTLSTGGVGAGGATAGYSSGGDKNNLTSYRSTSAVLGYQGGYRPSYTTPIENSLQSYSNNRIRKRQRHQSNEISAQHQWKPSNGFKKQKTNPQQSGKHVTLKNEPSDHRKTSTQLPKNKVNTASINENEKKSLPNKGLSVDYKKIAQFKAEKLARPAFRKVKADWHELKQNNFLSETDRYCVYFMKIALSRTGEEGLAQAILSTVYTRHRNALKLFRFALKTFMDKKYGEENAGDVLNKKMKFLIAVKGTLFKHLKMILVMRTGKELHVRADDTVKAAVKAVDNFLPELTGDKFTEEMIPSEDDYLIDPSKPQEDIQVRYFQHEFFILAYEVFSCRLRSLTLEDVLVGPSLENQLNFHFNNALIPMLLIEIFELEQKKIRVKETTLAIPKGAKKFVYVVNFQSQATSLQLRKRINNRIAQEHKNNDYLKTEIMDFIGQHEVKLSTVLVRNFANLILMFDELAKSIKYRLLNYTPHINLSSEMKKNTFDEIMKRMYTDTLVLLQNDVKSTARKIEAMEGIAFKKVGWKKELEHEVKEQNEQDTDVSMNEEKKVERTVVLIDNNEVADNVSMEEEEKVERSVVLIDNEELEK